MGAGAGREGGGGDCRRQDSSVKHLLGCPPPGNVGILTQHVLRGPAGFWPLLNVTDVFGTIYRLRHVHGIDSICARFTDEIHQFGVRSPHSVFRNV